VLQATATVDDVTNSTSMARVMSVNHDAGLSNIQWRANNPQGRPPIAVAWSRRTLQWTTALRRVPERAVSARRAGAIHDSLAKQLIFKTRDLFLFASLFLLRNTIYVHLW